MNLIGTMIEMKKVESSLKTLKEINSLAINQQSTQVGLDECEHCQGICLSLGSSFADGTIYTCLRCGRYGNSYSRYSQDKIVPEHDFGSIQIALKKHGVIDTYTILEELTDKELESILYEMSRIQSLDLEHSHVIVKENDRYAVKFGKESSLEFYQDLTESFVGKELASTMNELVCKDKIRDTVEGIRTLMKDGFLRRSSFYTYFDDECSRCGGFAIRHQVYKYLSTNVTCLECGCHTIVDPFDDKSHTFESYGVIQLVSTDKEVFEHYVIKEPLTEEEIESVLSYIQEFPDLDRFGSFFLVKEGINEEYLFGQATDETFYNEALLFNQDRIIVEQQMKERRNKKSKSKNTESEDIPF